MPPAYAITQSTDLAKGLRAIMSGDLFITDECVSRVQPFFESSRTPDGHDLKTGERVLAIWLVHPTDQSEAPPVGMAVVSQERIWAGEGQGRTYRALNVYVHQAHAGQGIGKALTEAAMRAHPDACGHYTADSVALYERAGVRDVMWVQLDPTLKNPDVAQDIADKHRAIHRARWAGSFPQGEIRLPGLL
jgi:GNAT superfamily N-acetyltransferase